MLEEASTRPVTTVAQDVFYCRGQLADLEKVTQKDASLKEYLKVMTDLSAGLNLSIGNRKPNLPATSQATDNAESVEKDTVDMKDIRQMVERHGHQLLAHWHLSATGSTPPWDAVYLQPAGPGVPRSSTRSARSARLPTNAQTQILHRDSGHDSSQYISLA